MRVRFRGVWPVAPRVLLGLSAALVARCVWLGLVALSIASCDRLGLAALLNVLRSRLDLPATIARERSIGLGRVVERASFDWLGFGRLICEIRGFRPRGAKKEAWLSAGPPFFMCRFYLLGFSSLVAEIEFSLCCGHRLPI